MRRASPRDLVQPHVGKISSTPSPASSRAASMAVRAWPASRPAGKGGLGGGAGGFGGGLAVGDGGRFHSQHFLRLPKLGPLQGAQPFDFVHRQKVKIFNSFSTSRSSQLIQYW